MILVYETWILRYYDTTILRYIASTHTRIHTYAYKKIRSESFETADRFQTRHTFPSSRLSDDSKTRSAHRVGYTHVAYSRFDGPPLSWHASTPSIGIAFPHVGGTNHPRTRPVGMSWKQTPMPTKVIPHQESACS